MNSCVGPQTLRIGLEVVTPVALFEFIRSSYADALQTHRLTMAIVESAASGVPVTLRSPA